MKRTFATILTTILLLGGGLACSSCKNFLNAGNIQKEIEEAIEIANSQPITYFVSIDKGSGESNPQSVSVKKKENFELIFVPEDNWKFICWETIDSQSGEVVNDIIKFENPENPQTKGYVINPREKTLIHPKCIQIPTVLSVEPAIPSYANTPIVIKFNIPVEEAGTSFEDSLFNLTNINLSCAGTKVNSLFEEPVFNEDKTELTFIPKSTADEGVLLKSYIEYDLNAGSAQIDILFSEAITIIRDDVSFDLTNQKLSVFYVPKTDVKEPVKYKLIVSRDSDLTIDNAESYTGNIFHQIDIAEQPDGMNDSEYTEKVFQNACDGTIYIYGRFFDEDSGVKSVVVKELMTHNIHGYENNRADEIITEYTNNTTGAVFITNNNQTTFLIKHIIKTDFKNDLDDGNIGGAVSLDISVNDYCYNSTDQDHYTAIVNWILPCDASYEPEIYYAQSAIAINNSWVDYEDYFESLEEKIKSLYVYYKYDYFNVYEYNDNNGYHSNIPFDKSTMNFLLEYTDTTHKTKYAEPVIDENGPFSGDDYDSDIKISFDLNDFTITPGTSVKLIFENMFGYTKEIIITSYPPEDFNVLLDIREENGTKKINSPYDLIRTNVQRKKECTSKKDLEPNVVYNIMYNGIIIKDFSFSVGDAALARPEAIVVDSVVPTKSSKKNFLTLTVNLNENSISGFQKIFYGANELPKGATSFSVDVVQSNLVGTGDYKLSGKLYGYKDNMKTNETPVTVPKFSSDAEQTVKEQYDAISPYFYYDMKGDKIEIKMKDAWSGIKEGFYIELNGNKICEFDSQHTSHTISMTEFIKTKNDHSYIHFYGKDKAGNIFDETKTVYEFLSPIFFEIQPWNKNNLSSDTVPANLKNAYVTIEYYVYKFDDEDGFTKKFTRNDSNKITTLNKSSLKTNFQQNSYLKIVAFQASNRNYYGDGYNLNTYSNPVYYYNGTPGNSDNDLLIPNGNSTTSMVVGSDKPVFVHTVVTSRPLKECKKWDYTEWEYYKEECGEKILHCEASPLKVYNIPMEEIDAGQNYVVIAHYSNNNVIMSEVMTR